ncbi:hypothetical protein [Qipengyuania huizhouensis]|uniref:hypothetical protein n=1 Tax=Qipengyuania huizhouensis TaxID=2867245 RepID=UPI001C86938C|nr:hypothetical protein [Qipengyuania huizhouensis]MBX7460386.1 hypothetical protein [Qipengyuania huizhouensis]
MKSSLQVDQLLEEVQAFHGQSIYKGLRSGIAKKRLIYRLLFPIVELGSRSRMCNFGMLFGLILFHPHFSRPQTGKSIFEYGPTRNNISAFDRLNACLPNELTDEVDLNGLSISFGARISTAISISKVWSAACALQRKRSPDPLPHLQSAIAVASFLLYTQRPHFLHIHLLCVASDHSPVAMALLFLARRMGVKTCYIQHAPVTESFPPLNYDLSLLYDQSSVAAYERSARARGVAMDENIEILPPYGEEFQHPKVKQPPYTVGICLSSIPQVERVTKLVDQIGSKPSVSGVLIRCHPRFRLEISRSQAGSSVSLQEQGQSLASFLDEVDIVLVPNSGVAMEALHRGRPTFFTDGMDELPSDYYGFVEEGVLPEFRMQFLEDAGAAMAHFDASWKARFANHDATVESSIVSAKERVAKAITKLLEQSEK